VEIAGSKVVERVRLKNVKTGQTTDIKADGIFIAIGYKPNNDIAVKLGIELDGDGYIKTDRGQRTSVPFVYAAGDITGSEKQIVVAAGQGSIAAISAFEDLSNPYWKGSRALPK
jgi:thioredoxin reductase (NADPH)